MIKQSERGRQRKRLNWQETVFTFVISLKVSLLLFLVISRTDAINTLHVRSYLSTSREEIQSNMAAASSHVNSRNPHVHFSENIQ